MFFYRVLGNLIYPLVKLLSLTLRYRERVGYFADSRKIHPYGSFIAVIWHQDLFSSILFGIKYGPFSTMASSSKDGELISATLKKLGYLPMRGSPKTGGIRAKMQIENLLKNGIPTALTVDGPKGPIHVVKSGVIEMAKSTGVPIIPFMALGRRNWVLHKSWDRLRIPKPFTQVNVYTGKPIYIPRDLAKESYGQIKEKIRSELFQARKILEGKS